MLLVYLLAKPSAWVIPWVLQAIAYFFILKKMGLKKAACVIPFLAERQMTRKLFNRMRVFYRPFIVAAVMALAGWYLDPSDRLGQMFMIVALIVYGIFLLRLYWRLTKSFGRGKAFYIGLVILPPLFLMVLGLGKRQYQPLQLKPVKDHGRIGNNLRRVGLVMISIVEIAVLICGVGLITLRHLPPAIQVAWEHYQMDEKLKDIKADDEVLSRADMMGDNVASVDSMKRSRELYFPDHSTDENVVVLTYIVGSNLENKMGLASVNIKQMIDASKQGDGLTFVVEAGGSRRWFTSEIEDSSYGRYLIKDGKLKKVKNLPENTCMSEGKTLENFLKWGKEKYPADRYMLVMWDHGGGLAMGFGDDDLNKPENNIYGTIPTSEVIKAIANSGIKYDMIGFDACLMQDIEIAAALEPYTDYYIASEETEGGYGWYYTEAFGKLAAEPGMPTEELGHILLSNYDQMNTIIKDDKGKPDTKATLSLVDTTLAKPAYDRIRDLFGRMEKAIKDDNDAYSSIAIAGTRAYNFDSNIQIDLIDFLTIMGKSDYEDKICSDEEIQDVIKAVQASVLYRNKDSAEGVNGVAVAFPYQAVSSYTSTSKQLKAMSMKEEENVFNVIFSIIAAQKHKEAQDPDFIKNLIVQSASEGGDVLNSLADGYMSSDLTEEEWYIKGYEDYNTAEALVDIPLKETPAGYQIQAPDKIWDIIADVQTMVYREADEGNMVYLGRDHIGADDEADHPLVGMDNSWVHIGGQPVCYEAEPVRETKKGDVHSGRVKAKLNGSEDIILKIEWDPVKEGETPKEGHITGYEMESNDIFAEVFNSRETRNLKSGDTIRFKFDHYDAEGNQIKTKVAKKKIRVTRQSRIKVSDEPMESGNISIGGVLTDIYQRTMSTEMVDLEVQ